MSGKKTSDNRPQTTDQTDGVLIIDKPADWTSHDVVAKVRKIMRTRRVGHTGTLDPFATGVLVVCLNRATRLVQFLTGDDKEYVATVRLGFATDTGDLTGAPIGEATDAHHITAELFEAALAKFHGRIQQTPPMYSAKKVGGVKLYEMARRGEAIERKPVEVEIKALELLPSPKQETGDFEIRVVCTSGTYIRVLAEDIGRQLGLGAHLVALRRTRAGQCELRDAVTLEQLAELVEAGNANQVLRSMKDALVLPEVTISAAEAARVLHGNAIHTTQAWTATAQIKLLDEQRQLIAIAEYDAQRDALQPRVVLIEQQAPDLV